ncbi:MAG: type II toxin-antitoxin system Phd/YefM family antitoxin [Terriglobales bacterium]
MTSVTVRDLRYKFPEIEKRLRRGETIEIRKRKEVLGRLVPAGARTEWPDFEAVQREVQGNKVQAVSAVALLRQDRDRGA